MSLLIAITVQDGIVFATASESVRTAQETEGCTIAPLGPKALWAGAGEPALIQRVGERLAQMELDPEPLQEQRDSLARAVSESLQGLVALDWRQQFHSNDYAPLLEMHCANFLFADWANGPRMLRINTCGVPEWVGGSAIAIGENQDVAQGLLQRYGGMARNVAQAQVLACKVLQDAAHLSGGRRHSQTDLWEVAATGARQCSTEEVRAIEQSTRELRQREAALLGNVEVTPAPDEAFSRFDLAAETFSGNGMFERARSSVAAGFGSAFFADDLVASDGGAAQPMLPSSAAEPNPHRML